MPKSHRSAPGKVRSKSCDHPGQGSVRIIGGQWRGRKLSVPDIEGLRPTGDRVRETLFNWLNAILPNANCLDLFAGSGALGFEALSRGAHSAVLVEKNHIAADNLRYHCQLLGANACVEEADAKIWLDARNHSAFDIVFLDPPFSEPLLNPVCQQLEDRGLLAADARVYIETPMSNLPTVPANWRLTRDRVAGQVAFLLYCRDG